jgi:hypothetical protein
MVHSTVIENPVQRETVQGEKELDARLAELLHAMHSEHLALQEVQPGS